MFTSQALDVSVGIVMVFLLVSVLLSALIEIIESILKTRAADLDRAIGQMLEDSKSAGASVEDFYNHPLIFALFRGDYEKSAKSWFFGRASGGRLPSYIPRDLFSTVIVDLHQMGNVSEPVRALIDTYKRLYGDEPAKLKANLESWYDGVMDRASGWYKRRTQKLLFWLGLALAVALNINPIIIAQDLSASPFKRQQMIALADKTVASGGNFVGADGTIDQKKAQELDKSIRDVGLPMGWGDFAIGRSFPKDKAWPDQAWLVAIVVAVFGWSITAIAATLGAPFWFDLLNKIMVIRSTVKPREKSGDEGSEDRKADPGSPKQPAAGVAPQVEDADGAVG